MSSAWRMPLYFNFNLIKLNLIFQAQALDSLLWSMDCDGLWEQQFFQAEFHANVVAEFSYCV